MPMINKSRKNCRENDPTFENFFCTRVTVSSSSFSPPPLICLISGVGNKQSFVPRRRGGKKTFVYMAMDAAAAAAAATGAKRRRRGSADSQRPSLRKTSCVATGPFSYDASLQTPTAAAADKTQEGIAKKNQRSLFRTETKKIIVSLRRAVEKNARRIYQICFLLVPD